MDPDAAWRNWNGSTGADRREAARALIGWLTGGGFEPDWTPAERGQFWAWVEKTTLSQDA